MITDKFQRPITSLRISITNRCNVNCFYCHHDGIIPQEYEMTPGEIETIARVARGIGIDKLRLSGGEPLIREDIIEILDRISAIGFKDISLTTNGILLGEYSDALVQAGLNRVNISFDTLNRDTYRFITKKDYMELAKKGIKKAVEAGLHPVKVNMVVMNGINENEIWDMFQFCKENKVVLQLIELLKTDSCSDKEFFDKYHYNMDEIENQLTKISDTIKTREFMQDRKKYFVDDGEIEIVKPMDNTAFCQNCTRIRITPDGKIKTCLLKNDDLTDLITHIQHGATDAEIKDLFIEAIQKRTPYYFEK
jgi:GTP 3',8-cyclase